MEKSAGEFKAGCLRLIDQVARTREPIVITAVVRGDIVHMPTRRYRRK
jgi:PHD/YefM family antitoxin component YafN of YafNO toxin-antitoxin module